MIILHDVKLVPQLFRAVIYAHVCMYTYTFTCMYMYMSHIHLYIPSSSQLKEEGSALTDSSHCEGFQLQPAVYAHVHM